ncbi:MAG TPA: D-alanine--D-alanine ligase [Candidatus Microsaccharimonas sp.]|nr:D-alanine--D-alanine ligase [Candidatus Microsaccharimonas sp.]
MTSVLVIAGGASPEREVSLRSGAAILDALKTSGYDVALLDPAEQSIETELTAKHYDVAFPIIHGLGGEDGSLQQHLEELGIAYVGSDAAACRLTFDKSEYKRALEHAGLPVPKGALVHSWDVPNHALFKSAFVLKPYDGGSSVDTFIIRDVTSAPWDAMRNALDIYGEMLLEELVEGVEITVGVLGSDGLPVIEIIPPSDGEFDYENKYNGSTQELCPPQHVSEATQAAAQALAIRAHELTGCRDLSRSDMIVRSDDSLVILETNTLPGMTDQSLFPKAANAAGLSMAALCGQLVQLALKH